MPQRFTPSEQAFLERLLAKAGTNKIPGSWLMDGSVPASKIIEADPIFLASPAASITPELLSVLQAADGRFALIEASGAATLARVVTLESAAAALDARVTVLEQPLTLSQLPVIPSFRVTTSAGGDIALVAGPGNETSLDGTFWTTEVYDTLGNFASGAFTAPYSGVYTFTLFLRGVGVGATDYIEGQLYCVPAQSMDPFAKSAVSTPSGAGESLALTSAIVTLSVGDVVSSKAYLSTGGVGSLRRLTDVCFQGAYLGRAA